MVCLVFILCYFFVVVRSLFHIVPGTCLGLCFTSFRAFGLNPRTVQFHNFLVMASTLVFLRNMLSNKKGIFQRFYLFISINNDVSAVCVFCPLTTCTWHVGKY